MLVFLNALLVLACVAAGLLGGTPRGVALWLTLAALLMSNGVFHLLATLRGRRYSPGVITGVGVYLPLGAYGYVHFLRSGQASPGTAVVALLLGASYPVWALRFHRERVRRSTNHR